MHVWKHSLFSKFVFRVNLFEGNKNFLFIFIIQVFYIQKLCPLMFSDFIEIFTICSKIQTTCFMLNSINSLLMPQGKDLYIN